jgi:hypothetical protein
MLNHRQALLNAAAGIFNMTNSKTISIQAIAIANLAFAAWGYYDLNHSVGLSNAMPPNWLAEFPYTKLILYLMFAFNGLLLSLLVWGSVRLFQSRPRGFVICCLVYVTEIVYWLGDFPLKYVALWLKHEGFARIAASVMANGVLGRSAIAAQMAVLYPPIGLFILTLTHLKSHLTTGRVDHP